MPVKVKFPDGSEREVPSTLRAVSTGNSAGLAEVLPRQNDVIDHGTKRRSMKVYQVSGVDAAGAEVAFATTDTPALALKRLQEARAKYLRAWVSDETGDNVTVPDLIIRAAQERNA